MFSVNPIVAAAAADILVGCLYYSDFAFGPLARKLCTDKPDMKKDLHIRYGLQIVASLMLATAFYIAILTFKKTELPLAQDMFTRMYSWFFTDVQVVHADCMASLKIAGFLWVGFVVPQALSAAAWHSLNFKKVALKAGGKLAQFLAMACTLAYFG